MPEELDLQAQQQNAKVNESLGLPADFNPLAAINSPAPYNPIPVGYGIKEQITGNPLTGPNPGLKAKPIMRGEAPIIDNTDYINAHRDKLSQTVDKSQDPFKQMQPYTFNGGHDGANFERYYSHSKASQLGFNPYRNNEELYNKHATFGDELSRAAGQWGNLAWTGFKSGITSWGDIMSGEPMAPDLVGAREMNKAMAIGSSSQKGSSFFVNTFLNSGYSVGIGLEMLAEELALIVATGLTAGTAAPATIPGMVATGTRGGMRIWDAWKSGNKAMSAYRDLNKVSDLKTFWNTNKLGQTMSATGRVLNPFSHTLGVMRGVGHTGEASKIVRYTNNFAEFARDFRDIKGAVTEAKLEGGLVQIDVTEKLIDKYKESHDGKEPTGKELDDIHSLAKNQAYKTAYWNMPVILWTNKVMYESIFKKLQPKKPVIDDMIIDESGAATVYNKKTGYSVYDSSIKNKFKVAGKVLTSPRKYGKFVGGYFKGNLAEGLQENLQETISGAAIDQALALHNSPDRGAYETFMGQLFSNAEKQVSMQGLETFASGFLMGAITQPVMSAPVWTGTTLWNQTVNRGDYKAYQAQRHEQLKKTADYLNKMHEDTGSYFAADMKHSIAQGKIAEDMYESLEYGDFKGAKDAQDQAKLEAIYIALRTGNYQNQLDKFADYKNFTPEELEDAFGLEKGQAPQAYQMLDSFQERAEKIKERFDIVNTNFRNPYNPSRYKKGSQEHESMTYAYHGFEEMKKSLIFGWATWDRNNQRIEDMVSAIATGSSPLSGTDAIEITKLMDPSSLRLEIEVLKSEMDTLGIIGTPEDKKLIAQKKEKMEHLMAYEEAMSNSEFAFDKDAYEINKASLQEKGFEVSSADIARDEFGNYVPGTVVHDTSKGLNDENSVAEVIESDSTTYLLSNGEVKPRDRVQPLTVDYLQKQFQVDSTVAARKAYGKYLHYLSGKSNSFVFNEKIEESFQLMLDFRAKNKENVNLVKYINYLNDPRAMLENAARVTKAIGRAHQEREKAIREGIHATVKKFEFNRAVTALFEDGWFVNENDLTAMIKVIQDGGKEMPVPTSFIKTDTSKEYKSGTPEYDQGLAIWNKHIPAIEQGFKDNLQEETKTEETGEVVETTTEPELTIVDPSTMSYDEYPQGLKDLLQDAFEMHVEATDTLPEEVTDDFRQGWLVESPAAIRIINNWNKDQRAKKPELYPVWEPQLITHQLPAGVTFESMTLDQVEKLYSDLLKLQKTSKTKERASDIQQVAKYLNDRKGRALRTPSTTAQATALDKVIALQAEVGNKTVNGKGYIINGEAYERTTNVVGRLMKDAYGYTRSSFTEGDTGKILLSIAQETINAKGTAEDFINKVKTHLVNDVAFGLFNSRKLDLMLTSLNNKGFTIDNVNEIVNEFAFEHTTIRGNQVDNHIREFFETGNLSPRPAYFTEEAYDNLGKILRKIRNKLTADGYIVQATDFTIWDESARVAGTLDLLLIDKAGNYIIYDIKTGSTSKWDGYEEPTGKFPHSVSMIENTLQLSIYKNILQNQTGIPVKGLAILPITTTEDLDGNVTSVSIPKVDTAGNPAVIPLTYDANVEREVPLTAVVQPIPTSDPVVAGATPVKEVKAVSENQIKYLNNYLKSLKDNIKRQDILIRTTEESLATDQKELDDATNRIVELRTFLERGSEKELRGKKRAIKAEIKTLQAKIDQLEKSHELLLQEREKVNLQRERLDVLVNVTLDALDEVVAGKLSKVDTIKQHIQDRLTKIKDELGFRAMLIEEEIETVESRIATLRQALVNLGMADELIDLHLSGNLERELKNRITKINQLVQEDHGYADQRQMLLTLQRRLTKTKDNSFTKQFSWVTAKLIKNYQRLSTLKYDHIAAVEALVPSTGPRNMKNMLDVLTQAQLALDNMEFSKPTPVAPVATETVTKKEPAKVKAQFSNLVGNSYISAKDGMVYTVTNAEADTIIATNLNGAVSIWPGAQLEAAIKEGKLKLKTDTEEVTPTAITITFTDDSPQKIFNGTKTLTNRTLEIKSGVYKILRINSQTKKVDATDLEVEITSIGNAGVVTLGVQPEVWLNGNHVNKLKESNIPSVYDSANDVTIITTDDYAKAEGYTDWADFKKNNKDLDLFINGNDSRPLHLVKPVNADKVKKPTPKIKITKPELLKKDDIVIDEAGNEYTVVYYEGGYDAQFSSDDNVTFPGEEEHLYAIDSNGKDRYFTGTEIRRLSRPATVTGIQIATDRSPKAKAKLKKLGFDQAMVDAMTEEDFQDAMTFTSVDDAINLLEKYAPVKQKEMLSLQQAKDMITTAPSLESLAAIEKQLTFQASLNKLEGVEELDSLLNTKRKELLSSPVASSLKKGSRVLINGVQFRVTNDPSKGNTVNVKQVAGTESMKIPIENVSTVIDSIIDPTVNIEPVIKEISPEESESIKLTAQAARELTDQEFDEDAAAGKAKYSKGGALKGFEKVKCK